MQRNDISRKVESKNAGLKEPRKKAKTNKTMPAFSVFPLLFKTKLSARGIRKQVEAETPGLEKDNRHQQASEETWRWWSVSICQYKKNKKKKEMSWEKQRG